MQQNNAPLWQALLKYKTSNSAQFHVPGHRGGKAIPEDLIEFSGASIFELDLTEIPGVDDLHNPQEVIAEAQRLCTEIYQADRSFFLVNGTSCGLVALILACCGAGDKIIVPRNAHRSVISGLILSGAFPIYYTPPTIEGFYCLAGADARQIEQLIKKHKNLAAVIAINPTYYGITGDLTALAGLCHSYELPLIVDEAHGAHFKFHREMPPDALSCKADAVVQSTHKTGGSLTQSSLLHLRGELIDYERVAETLRMVQSTSPSYLLMVSLDLARRQLALSGEKLVAKALRLSRWCRDKLADIPGVSILGQEHLGTPGAKSLDETRLTISLLELGLTGYKLAELLHQQHGVIVEMADYASIVGVISIGTTADDCRRMVRAVEKIARTQATSQLKFPQHLEFPEPVVLLSPREAWHKQGKKILLEKSLGYISGETVAVYPPGIPVLCPGEEITRPVLDYLLEVRKQGYQVQGPGDASLREIRVIV